MRARRHLARDQIISIFMSHGPGKVVAGDHSTSEATVSQIRRGRRHKVITHRYMAAALHNGFLVTMACGVEL